MKFEISKKAKLPTKYGEFWIQSFREILETEDLSGQKVKEHLVIFTDDVASGQNNIPLVRLHSECLTGDVLGSLKCDCGPELEFSLKTIAKNGGIVLYLRQEGRGIGLFNKVNAYALQDGGLDTVEANVALGLPEDCRNYEIVGAIFAHYGIDEIRLLTNNPLKVKDLEKFAKVSRESIIVGCNAHNKQYLKIKKEKMGHMW